MTTMHAKTLVRISPVVMLLWALPGCQESKPPPEPPRRLIPDPITLDQLDALVDTNTQYLAQNLPTLPEVRNSEYQQVLMVGPIEDQTFSERSRFEAALKSMISGLQANRAISDAFIIRTTTTADPKKILEAVSGGDTSIWDDPLSDEPKSSGVEEYHPDSIYLLTGKFFQHTDDKLRSYRLFVEIEHPRTGRSLLTHEYKRDLKWNPDERRWKVND
jgi:hypothetical protein